jgi:hypothetical protein
MDPITLALLFAAGGLAKNQLVDKPREERDRKMQAATTRYSPWTKLKADPVRESDPFGNAMQFGTTGLLLGQNAQNAAAQNKLMTAQTNWLENGGNPMANAAMTNPAAAAQSWDPGMASWSNLRRLPMAQAGW